MIFTTSFSADEALSVGKICFTMKTAAIVTHSIVESFFECKTATTIGIAEAIEFNRFGLSFLSDCGLSVSNEGCSVWTTAVGSNGKGVKLMIVCCYIPIIIGRGLNNVFV